MKFSRRARGIAGLAFALVVLAVVFDEPLVFAGAAGVAGWLTARQLQFVRAVGAATDEVAVRQTPTRRHATTDDPVTVALTVEHAGESPLRTTVEATPPVATRSEPSAARTVRLAAGEESGATTFALSSPVAGRHRFGDPRLTFEDADGLFASTTTVESDAVLTVEPRAPREVHVGEGGERTGAFGEHDTGRFGPGLEAAELREYTPGDPTDSIDWKATARLATPYVREFEVQTDLRSVLVVDHRASMGEGGEGERKLDYARAVALAVLAASRANGEAVGLLAVGDDGLTERIPPDAGQDHYARVARVLHDLEPTAGDRRAAGGRAPDAARRAARILDGDDSRFARRLSPFFAERDGYVQRIAGDPLYEAVRTQAPDRKGTVVTMVFTDDTRRAEVRETIRVASRGDDRVMAFLTPTVLFAPGDLGDLDRAYDEYVAFEEYRRGLAGVPRTTAYEVGPEARLEALLANPNRRRVR